MAIKLYKSQLEPTTQSSNVLDPRKISMSEAGAVGRAFKGFASAGEKLYVKHQEIKSEKEVLEKIKTVMNGENGLAVAKLNAIQMDDPDKAMAYYNNEIEKVKNSTADFTGLFSKKKFNTWLTKQSIEDGNTIKVKSTANLIEGRKTTELEYLETLKKKVIFAGSDLEKNNATIELETRLNSTSNNELFGGGIEDVKSAVAKDIAFYGYKRVPLDQQDQALELAKKDDRLSTDDVLKLEAHFSSQSTTSNHLNKANVSQMQTNIENGININVDEFNTALSIATTNKDEATILKLMKIQEDAPIYAQLNTMSVSEIENRINILTNFNNTNKKGMSLKDANNLEISKKYLAALSTSLDKDQLTTAKNKGLVQIDEIGFDKLLEGGDMSLFSSKVKSRIAQATTVANFYKRPLKFFTENEAKQITAAFDSATNSNQVIQLSTALVQAFGVDSDIAFRQISKDNTFLAHIGGLTMMNDGVAGKNAKLAIDGYLLSKEPDLADKYKMKSSDTGLLNVIGKYSEVFGENLETFNNAVETANYIYAAQLKNSGKTTKNFKASDWEKAFSMAVGATTIEKFGFDTKMGGFDTNTRGTMVHIPPWLPNGKFEDVVENFKTAEGQELFKKASTNDQLPMIDGEEFTVDQVFKERDPYFVSIGNGKYKIAMGENPKEFGGDPEYLINSDGGFFIIDINKIKAEIITGL